MCAYVCACGQGSLIISSPKLFDSLVNRCAHVLSQKVLDAAGNKDWCGGAQTVFEFYDFVREAEGIDFSSQRVVFDSFFACISVVCGSYLTKRWI